MNIIYDVLLAKRGRLKSQHLSDRSCEPSKIKFKNSFLGFSLQLCRKPAYLVLTVCLKRSSVCIFPKIEVIGMLCYKIRVNN